MRLFHAAALVFFIAPAVAIAAPPPAGALKLSQIVAKLESDAGANLAYIDEVEWDDDGYWEAEYYTTAGAKVKVRLDPATGAQRRRN
ncbi:PepSY domain-containing protein [Paracoccus alkenifer]|uniref:Peptidase propeptide and YPEB domain-containing protein n=1 Tax=Paracoccus alkenifer TaxID=65735 RepID=A0A1H6LEW0_9RHOB|nr:PepSY domain-containing protein [Paracoccus alkenifer]SEH83268.1 Peptidase propeptide and YPEB domain-containing protein [Paracoccus alkenifer]